MSSLLNPRHEAFAQNLARGFSASKAYEAAGYRSSRSGASELRKKPNVAERVAELLRIGVRVAETEAEITSQAAQHAIERVAINRSTVLQMVISDRERALAAGQIKTALHAAELLGIELGMFVRRTDNKHEVRRYSDLPEEERLKEAERVTALARAILDRKPIIEGQAERVDVLGSTE